MRGTCIRIAASVAATVLALGLLAATSFALTVGNPPAHAGSGFTLSVKGAKGTVSVYLSPARKPAKGDVLLGRLKVKHGKLKIAVSSKVKPGSYYVLVCTGSGKHQRCTASRHATVVIRAGTLTPASGGSQTGTTASSGSGAKGSEETKPKEEPKKEGPKEHSKLEEDDLEPGKPVEGEIEKGKEGGIAAEGAEGTKYELVYVAEAAEPEIHVKLTPITSVTGQTGTMVGGVDIEPEGTLFARDAYLIILPPSPISESGREAVKFTGTGQELHGTPFLQQSNRFILPVASGGGYALFTGATIKKLAVPLHTGLRSALTASLARPDSAPLPGQATYENELAEALQGRPATKANEELGEEGSTLRTEIKDTLESWYEAIELQKIPPGETEDEAAETAIKELCAWGRAGALLLGDQGEKVIDDEVINKAEGMSKIYGSNWEETKIFEPARKMTGKAYDRAQEACRNEHDLTKIEKIFKWTHDYVLLGGSEPSFEQMLSCENFKVTFESRMNDKFLGEGGAAKGEFINEYTATVKVKPKTESTASFPLLGEAAGKYAKVEGTAETVVFSNNEECINEGIEQSGNGAPFVISSLTVLDGFGAAAGSPAITFSTGMPTENVLYKANTEKCDPFPMVEPGFYWWSDWDAQHKGEAMKDTVDEYKLPMAAGGGAEFGSAEFTDVPFTKNNAEGHENTTIKVTQSPGTFTKL